MSENIIDKDTYATLPLTTTSEMGEEAHPRMYLNIFVAQKTPEMDAIIQEKIDETVPNPLGFGLLRKAAGKVALKKVTTDLIASKMAAKIPAILPEKMSQMGIKATAEEVYRKGSFVVLRIAIVECDIHQLLSEKAGEEKAVNVDRVLECVKSLFRCLGKEDVFVNSVQGTMASKIVQGLCQKLPVALPEAMAEKGLIVDVVAKSEADEAAFFFEALRQLDPDVAGAVAGALAGGAVPEFPGAQPPKKKFFAKFRGN